MRSAEIEVMAKKSVFGHMDVENVGAVRAACSEQSHYPITRHIAERKPAIRSGYRIRSRHHALDPAFIEGELKPVGSDGRAGNRLTGARLPDEARDDRFPFRIRGTHRLPDARR
jgi:hypothetical protein